MNTVNHIPNPSLYTSQADFDFAIGVCSSMYQQFQKLTKNVDEARAPELYQIKDNLEHLLTSEDGCVPWSCWDSMSCLSATAETLALELPRLMEAKMRARHDLWEIFEEEIESALKRMLLAIQGLSDRKFNLNIRDTSQEPIMPFNDVAFSEESRHEKSFWLH